MRPMFRETAPGKRDRVPLMEPRVHAHWHLTRMAKFVCTGALRQLRARDKVLAALAPLTGELHGAGRPAKLLAAADCRSLLRGNSDQDYQSNFARE